MLCIAIRRPDPPPPLPNPHDALFCLSPSLPPPLSSSSHTTPRLTPPLRPSTPSQTSPSAKLLVVPGPWPSESPLLPAPAHASTLPRTPRPGPFAPVRLIRLVPRLCRRPASTRNLLEHL